MEITNIKIRRIISEGKLCAFASVTFDNEFAVHDIRVLKGSENDSYFIAMPFRKNADGRQMDIAHPMNNDFRTRLMNAIVGAYKSMITASSEADAESAYAIDDGNN